MSQVQPLMARDGHEFSAYIVRPEGAPRGAVVVLQELFGVNAYIRSIADRCAGAGYLAIAPSLYDRIGRDIELGYSEAEIQTARGYMMQVDPAKALLDITAALAIVRHVGRVGVLGFCWGGQLAWRTACEQTVHAAVCYYGTRIGALLPRVPLCPTLLHFGEHDQHIPPEEVERIHAAFPQGIIHRYPAGHGFACDQRTSYEPASATLAWQRTLDFLTTHLG
jgi:carboxymethylenebutenolidase